MNDDWCIACGVLGPDIPDSRDYKYAEKIAASGSTVSNNYSDCSLRKSIGPILNQRTTNSCTGHSAVYGMNVLLNRIAGVESGDYGINPWWPYYWARFYSGLEHRDGGAYMRSLMNALLLRGVYSNSMSSPDSKPGQYDLKDAFTLKEYFRISNDLNELKYALSEEKLPVFANIAVYNDDMDSYSGIITPNKDGFSGYHAICLTGLKTIKGVQYIEFANSWGTNWGDNGFGYIHPDCITDNKYMVDMYCPSYKYN